MMDVVDAELVVGIVGRIGVETSEVCTWIGSTLHKLHYRCHTVKITDYLKTKNFDFPLNEASLEERYKTYIEACNSIRSKAGRNDFFVAYAIDRIINFRANEKNGSSDVPARRVAYIVDQIKRPEEAAAFRRVYGQQFILISCHLPIDTRRESLARRIASAHASQPRTEQWHQTARELIVRDEQEINVPFGQRVSEVFRKRCARPMVTSA